MVNVPANWHDMTNNEKKSWANENGLEYQFNTVGLKGAIDSKEIIDLKADNQRLQDDLENAKTKLTIISEQSWAQKLEAAGNPVGITSPEGLKLYVEAQAQKDKGDDPVSHNRKNGQGAGQIGLEGNLNSGNNSKSWEDNESMIFELVQTKNIGTPEERKNAQSILNALWEKQKDAIKSGDLPNKIYEDDLKDGKSLFRRIMDAKDNEIRARLQKEREK